MTPDSRQGEHYEGAADHRGTEKPPSMGMRPQDKAKALDLLAKALKNAIPEYKGAHDDATAMAVFLRDTRDAFDANVLIRSLLETGISEAEMLHLLCTSRVSSGSFISRQLHLYTSSAEAFHQQLGDMQKLTSYLVETGLSEQAIADTEMNYKRLSIGTREDPSAATTRVRILYETACLQPCFQERNPFSSVPQQMVLAMGQPLRNLVQYNLNFKNIKWKAEDLRGKDRTTIIMALAKVQEEMRVTQQQEQSMRQAVRGESTPAPNSRDRPFRSQARLMVAAEESPEEEHVAVLEPKAPVGKLGPPVPDASRRRVTFKGRAPGDRLASQFRKRMPKRARPGEPGYTGCHNCGSTQHYARDCTQPMTDRLAALLADPENWSLEDMEECLWQGMHPQTDQVTDADQVLVLCATRMEGDDSEDDQPF